MNHGLRFVALFVILLSGSAVAQDRHPVIEQMLATLRRLESVEIRATKSTTLVSTKLVVEKLATEPVTKTYEPSHYVYRRRSKRDVDVMITDFPTKEYPWKTDQIVKRGESLSVTSPVDERGKQINPNEIMVTLESPKLVKGVGNQGKGEWMQPNGTWSARPDGPERAAQSVLESLMDGCNESALAWGYIGYFPLADYFSEKSEIKSNEAEGLIEVESRSPLGKFKVWLDPTKGGLPRKFVLRKDGRDLFHSAKMLQEIKMNGDQELIPSGGVENITYTADNIELVETQGVWWIKKISLVEKMVTSSGPVVTKTTEIEVESVDFDRKFTEKDFAPSLQIPKNHPVTIVGREGLNFKWNGTKVVPGGRGF